MPSARDAREWSAEGGLRGIGDSLLPEAAKDQMRAAFEKAGLARQLAGA